MLENDHDAQRAVACARCSRRKQKCDRKLPSCLQCIKAGAECKDTEAEGTVTRSSTGSIQRKGIVRQLEDRIAELEAQLAERNGGREGEEDEGEGVIPSLQPRLISDSARNDTDQQGQTPIRHNSPIPRSEETGSQEMDLELLSMRALAEPRNRASEFLKDLSMPRLISAMTETYGGNPEIALRADPLWDGIGKHIRQPKADDLERLHIREAEALASLNTYLDVVDFRYPRLPVHKVKNGILAIADEEESTYKITLNKDPAHIFMAYMVMAIVPLVSDTYPVSQGSFISIHLLAKSLKVLEVVFKKEDGVDIIQCLLLLVIFSIHSSAAGSSWLLIGIAMKKCIALGYHQEAINKDPKQFQDELEQKRWAFWSCYYLDRLIGSALNRPFSISDRYVKVPFPSDDSSVPQPSAQPTYRHTQLFRYAVLLSDVVRDKGRRSFSDHLSHVFHWEAATASLEDRISAKEKSYLMSLHNTLLLRIIIDQLIASQGKYSGSACDPAARLHAAQLDIPLNADRSGLNPSISQRLQIMNTLETCLVVIQSLNRTTMRNRSFLSWITGYSAFSVALVSLYCLSNADSIQTEAFSIGSLAAASPYSVLSERHGRGSKIDNLLYAACRILEVVSRQFPKLQSYRKIVENLQDLLGDTLSTDFSISDLLIETKASILLIGPTHLRYLAMMVFSPLGCRHGVVF